MFSFVSATCLLGIAGIWPFYIEPKLLAKSQISIQIPNLPPSLENLKILQFSDLHFNPSIKNARLNKIIKVAKSLKPDIIVYTGDFLCQSKLKEKEKLKNFLNQFSAPYGCFAVLGNHDYSEYVSIDTQGNYSVIHKNQWGVKRLLKRPQFVGNLEIKTNTPNLHTELIDTLKKTPFHLLHNESALIAIKDSYLNVLGVGEYMTGHFKPDQTFKNYNPLYPGIILAHNPDAVPTLSAYPGDLILCGHTHGGQINLPWIWNRLTLIENTEYKRGLKKKEQKWIYTNRGLGATHSIRLFSSPEITLLTLNSKLQNQV